MAKSKAAAANAAIEETAVVEKTTAKTYTQEELDAILAEKLKKQNETIEPCRKSLNLFRITLRVRKWKLLKFLCILDLMTTQEANMLQ